MSIIDIEELGTKHLRVTDPYRGIPKDTLTEYILDIIKEKPFIEDDQKIYKNTFK